MGIKEKDFFAPSFKKLLIQDHIYDFTQHNQLNVLGRKINEETGEVVETLYLQPKSLFSDRLIMLYPGEPYFYQEKIILPVFAINTKNVNLYKSFINETRNVYFQPIVLIQLDLDLIIEYINNDYSDADKTNGIVYLKPITRFSGLHVLRYSVQNSVVYRDNKCFVSYHICEDNSVLTSNAFVDCYTLPLTTVNTVPTTIGGDD